MQNSFHSFILPSLSCQGIDILSFAVSNLVDGLKSDLSFTTTSVDHLTSNLKDDFSQAIQKVVS